MRRRSFSLLVCSLAALLTCVSLSCGSGDDFTVGTAMPEDTGLPLSEVPEHYAAAACASIEACAGPALEILLNGEDCETLTRRRLEDELESIEAGIEAGIVFYDGTRIEECFEDLEDLKCELATTRRISRCEDALRGTLEEGDECELSAACEPGTYCKTDLDRCPGVCTELEDEGGACARNEECDDGLVCGASGQCEKPADLGDPCRAGNPDCAPGLICVGADDDAGTAGECHAVAEAFVGELDDPCAQRGEPLCEPELSCAFSLSGAACKAGVALGEPCQAAVPDQCPSGAYCALRAGLAGTCTPKPKAGEACGSLLGAPICEPYARCIDGICVELDRVGGSCSDDRGCYTDNCRGGKCVPFGVCD